MDRITLHQFGEKLELLGYAKRSVADYREYVRYFLEYLETHEQVTDLAQLTGAHINAYHAFLRYAPRPVRKSKKAVAASIKSPKLLSSRTVSLRMTVLKTFFRVMHRERLLDHDYSGFVSIATPPRALPRYVPTEKEMATLLGSIEPSTVLGLRDRCMFELLYATGLRNEELRTVTVDRLELTERTLRVKGKGSKERVVPIGEWVVPYLLEYLRHGRPTLARTEHGEHAVLFVSKHGRPLTKNLLGYLIRRYATKAGVCATLHPHAFRHACATHLLRGGADIRYVQELLGHESLNSTQIYTKVDISHLKRVHTAYHPRERTHHGDSHDYDATTPADSGPDRDRGGDRSAAR